MYTVFEDNFNGSSIDRNKWRSELIHRGIGQLIDSSLTHSVSNGKLGLTMAYVPNYNDSSDFVGAEFWTNEYFSYGSFECKATFAKKWGSWPAFWSFHATCINNEGPEIDFAEYSCKYKYDDPNHFGLMGHYIHHWICGGGGEVATNFHHNYVFATSTNIYKCIWTPNKINYYVDGDLKYSIIKKSGDWWPITPVYVILSQQITQPYDLHGHPVTPYYPQTSFFDYIKVKKFFLSPEITCPKLICSSGTATLDVDSKASNITWNLSPSGLFTGATSGSGKIASINAGSAIGEGKITYSFEMPGGETFEAEETFWVGKPSLDVSSEFFKIISADGGSDYVCTDQAGNEFDLSYFNNKCGCTNYEIKLTGLNGITVYDQFYTSGNGDLDYPYLSEGWYIIWARGYNACGWGDWVSTELEFRDCSQMLLLFTPNPTTGETTMSIESTSKEKTFDENTTWDFEVYSETQLLKKKQTNLRGQSTKIQTNGWKEGVYSVRVKYQNEILTGKLVVKR